MKSSRAPRVDRVAPDPRLEGLPVPLVGAVGCPRRVERDTLRQSVEARLRLGHVGEHDWAQAWDRPGVATRASGEPQQVVAVVVGGERLEPEVLGEVRHAVLPGADPLPAVVDGRPVVELLREHTTADTVARLEHDHVAPLPHEHAGGGQASQPGADHADIGLELLVRHRRTLGPRARSTARPAVALAEPSRDDHGIDAEA